MQTIQRKMGRIECVQIISTYRNFNQIRIAVEQFQRKIGKRWILVKRYYLQKCVVNEGSVTEEKKRIKWWEWEWKWEGADFKSNLIESSALKTH